MMSELYCIFYSINKVSFFQTIISHFCSKHFPPVTSVTLHTDLFSVHPLLDFGLMPTSQQPPCTSIVAEAHFNAAKFQRQTLKGTIVCWETVGRSSICLRGGKSQYWLPSFHLIKPFQSWQDIKTNVINTSWADVWCLLYQSILVKSISFRQSLFFQESVVLWEARIYY